MTDAPAPEAREHLEFHGPLSSDRAARLVARLAATGPSTVVDYGCGWGGLLIRLLEQCPRATGTGIDIHTDDIALARRNAAARGVNAQFIEGPAADHPLPADVVLSVGAYHAFGTVAEALVTLKDLVNPGGRLLFGAELWERPPTPEQLANMWAGITADDCVDLPTMAELAVAAGFRLLHIESATRDEWDDFEFGFTIGKELGNPGPEKIAELDTKHNRYLRGTRDVMGFAYLTLGRLN